MAFRRRSTRIHENRAVSVTTRVHRDGRAPPWHDTGRARVTTAVDHPHDSFAPTPTRPDPHSPLAHVSVHVSDLVTPAPRGILCRGRITQVGTDREGGGGAGAGGGSGGGERRGTSGTPESVPSSGFGDPKTRRDRETPPTVVPTARWRRYSGSAAVAVAGSPFTHICCRIIRPGSGPHGGFLQIISRLTSPGPRENVQFGRSNEPTDRLLLHTTSPQTHLGGRTEACGVSPCGAIVLSASPVGIYTSLVTMFYHILTSWSSIPTPVDRKMAAPGRD